MNEQVEALNSAKEYVDAFRSIVTNKDGELVKQTFPDEVVGVTVGMYKSTWYKTYSKLKPSELKYIIKYLHNCTVDMLFNALLAYLRYFQTKKKSEYEKVYRMILKYYTAENKNRHLTADNDTTKQKIYLLELYVGTSKFYKVGVSKNVYKRVSNIRSDIASKYDMLSTSVNIIDVWVTESAEELEASFVKSITTKCKYCFVGSSEAFEDDVLKKKILLEMEATSNYNW